VGTGKLPVLPNRRRGEIVIPSNRLPERISA